MADNVSWQPPALNSTNPNLKTSQKYNNITRAQIQSELAQVRSGNGRPGLGEDKDGHLVCTDAEGTRRLVAREDRDEVISDAWRRYGHVGISRLHSLLSRKWCNISKGKIERWTQNSEVKQLHTAVLDKTVVRPVWSSTVLRHVQIDLTDWKNSQSHGYKWILSCMDIYSKYAVCIPMTNEEQICFGYC